ncbi:hypothetical protein CBM2609_B70343 [Cupriavidus taiwanensis]|nr:hypothetical protein CBM2604_B60340 [Cupriavidus taiwanensis]SOZ33407.1 hypothetical protein CBM2609_B70343 [Cupriavidus taiwanensis]SOZ48720.1 hypothetical protein CBM2610_B50343 [Cupriavidus taiwanensis]SPA01358.1 hypothetical protein CBM2626_B110300 [Cupriavidus taiwanensis]
MGEGTVRSKICRDVDSEAQATVTRSRWDRARDYHAGGGQSDMAGKNPPLLLDETSALPGKHRQKFLYSDLYKNVRKDLIESVEICAQSIKHHELPPRYRVNAQASVYLNTFWLWTLEYTAGRSLDELAKSFSSVVKEFVIWNELNIPYRRFLSERFKDRGETDLTICAVDFDNRIEYQNALQLISIAILLRDEVSVNRIISAMGSNRHVDALYETTDCRLCSGFARRHGRGDL